MADDTTTGGIGGAFRWVAEKLRGDHEDEGADEGSIVDAVRGVVDGDADDDSLTNAEELRLGTNPFDNDTDGDLITDQVELREPDRTDPTRADTDGDGISDGVEMREFFTDPNDPDTDGDGLTDGFEVVINRSDPTDPDSTELFGGPADPVVDDSTGPRAPVGAADRGSTAASTPGGEAELAEFMELALGQLGDEFRMGAEASIGDADPDAFDSSELVQWAANRSGARMPDGSWNQYKAMSRAGATTGVDDALARPGALVFRFSTDPFETEGRPTLSHVAISLGDGRVLEATTRGDRTVQVNPAGDRFTHAAVIPEFAGDTIEPAALAELLDRHGVEPSTGATDEEAPPAPVDRDAAPPAEQDDPDGPTDADGEADTDVDTAEGDDAVEDDFLSTTKDSDFDGITNDQEMMGTILAGQNIGSTIDRDDDGLTDLAEERLGTDPDSRDSDGDNIPDLMEIRLGTDPLAADTVLGVEPSDGTAEGDVLEGLGKVDAIARQQSGEPVATDAGSSPSDPSTGADIPAVDDVVPVADDVAPAGSAPIDAAPVAPDVVAPELAEPEPEPTQDFFQEVDESVDSLTADVDELDG